MNPDSLPSLKLEKEKARWAIKHLCRYGDTDIFPVVPELLAIKSNQDRYCELLTSLNLKNHRFSVPRRLSVPKVSGGYRIASQLDADDAALMAGLVYGSCRQVEKSRIPHRRKMSCSYRVKPDSDGGYFKENNGYDDYKEATVRYLNKQSHKWVLSVDISDFYNQISHHRVRNNLDSAGCSSDVARHIENCLGAFCSNHHSRGIPVGPSASIILAEAALIDFDDWMVRNDAKFCRYVDDFRVFFKSELDARTFLADFTSELYHSHRLSPNAIKTKIVQKEEFVGIETLDEEELEKERKLERLRKLVSEMDNPSSDVYEPHDNDLYTATMQAVKDLFEVVNANEPLPLGLARFTLRRARVTRTRAMANDLLNSLDKFAPVMRDVVLYLLTVDKKGERGYLRAFVEHFKSTSVFRNADFVKEWALHACIRCPGIFQRYSQHQKVLQTCGPELRELYGPLLAASNGKWEEVRSYKEMIDGVSRRGRRAIVLAASVLSNDEKKHWLPMFENEKGDMAMRICAMWAKATEAFNWTR